MRCGWVVVYQYLKLLMESRCPKIEIKITGFCISMLLRTDQELFAVCYPLLFVIVVNEKDMGSDLWSCLYLILFLQLFYWTFGSNLTVAGRVL